VGAIDAFSGDISSLTALCQAVRVKLDESEVKVGQLERLCLALPKSDVDARHDVTMAVKRHRQAMAADLTALRDASRRALDAACYDERQALLTQSADASSDVR